MIINVRGANGSGKSTVVRRVMEAFQVRDPIHTLGRSRPLGYVCGSVDSSSPRVFVPGSYETPTGGCDTISQIQVIYDLVKTYADVAGINVLFEGILAQHSATRLREVASKHETFAVVLTTPLSTCVESVRARRLERGDDRPFDPKNVEKEYKSVLSSTRALRAAGGLTIVEASRDEALAFCIEKLGVKRCAA